MLSQLKLSLFGIALPLVLALPALAESTRLTALRDLILRDRQTAERLEHSSFAENFDDSDKPVLLVIHGLHESPRFMIHWVDFFTQRNYQVVSIRLPGHFDRSGKSLDNVKAEDWIKTANEYFQSLTLNNSKVSILGYSTGGTLATRLALQFPDRVEKLFLISPALSLSAMIKVSSTFLSPIGLSGKKICKDPNSNMCLMLKRLDKQAQMMLNDGLDMSPQAGSQVGRLIDLTFQNLRTHNASSEIETSNQWVQKVEALAQMQTPTYIADSELDDVVDVKTNYEWMKTRGLLKNYLLFKKQDGIFHALMARGPESSFSSGTLRFNPRIDQIEKLFERGISE